MIKNSNLLFTVLCSIVVLIQFLSCAKGIKKIFNYLPVPFWCYFTPTILSTLNFIPYEHALYNTLSKILLPSALFLLLIGTDIPSLFKLSKKALIAMGIGTVGIFLGGIGSFLILINYASSPLNAIEQEFWKGWGCLSATWTGGSANMISVREILQTPASLFSNLIITDTVVAYCWMALLVFLSQYQKQIDNLLGIPIQENFKELSSIDSNALPALEPKTKIKREKKIFQEISKFAILLILSYLMTQLYFFLAQKCPEVGIVLNQWTWVILFATLLPLLLSCTKLKKIEDWGALKLGNFLLYILLTSIGAKANLHALTHAPLFISLGFSWVFFHGFFLLLFSKIYKIPIFLLATASQANVGGTISAPLVASIYQKNSAPLGVILAILGNIYGTWLGLLLAEICRNILDLLK
ncbi:MAG: DUF819 family protein [Elusimicrobia bacterium]|nr:DUF819 family protein [Elusimicrobiota bacterium]